MAHHITQMQTSAWLRRKKNDQVVGKTNDPENCPFHTMLTEVYGLEEVVVSINNYWYTSKRTGRTIKKELPLWAKCVLNRIDDIGTVDKQILFQPISVREVKKAAEEVGVKL